MEKYGDNWTEEKLKILGKYLDAYTTALKRWNFHLIYVDAFAGPGYVQLNSGKGINGSPQIAFDIKSKPFDELLFNDLDKRNYSELEKSFGNYKRVKNSNKDANIFLKNLNRDWKRCRGVLFVDPFATQFDFATLRKVASYNALDTWILFPRGAITQQMPVYKTPDEVDPSWGKNLTRVFGSEIWRDAYRDNEQQNLHAKEQKIRDRGARGAQKILELYKQQLRDLFKDRFVETSKTLRTSKNSPIFEFIFCVGNKAGIGAAESIAKDIIKREEKLSKALPEPPPSTLPLWRK